MTAINLAAQVTVARVGVSTVVDGVKVIRAKLSREELTDVRVVRRSFGSLNIESIVGSNASVTVAVALLETLLE